MERKELTKQYRGKRYAINAEKLLNDTDIYYLAYVGKLSTELINNQLKENYFSALVFKTLEEKGFNIRDYWVIESEKNTIKVDESLLYEAIDSIAKYKKLAYKLKDFMNVRMYKPLKSYIEFCDAINTSYLTFCDDEDYLLYLDELEKKQLSLKEEKREVNHNEESKEEKPKAYIKNQRRIEEHGSDDKLTQLLSSPIKWNEKKYGNDLKSITSLLARVDSYNGTNKSSLEYMYRKYSLELTEDFRNALMVRWIEQQFDVHISKPTYISYILNPMMWCICGGDKFFK